jgi:hypothetical protein
MFLIWCVVRISIFSPFFTRFLANGKRISIYIHFDPFINQKEALVLPLFSY